MTDTCPLHGDVWCSCRLPEPKPEDMPSYAALVEADRRAQVRKEVFATAFGVPNPGQTHYEDCWKDGPQHYHCAVEQLNGLEAYCRALMDKPLNWQHNSYNCGWNASLGYIIAEFLGIDDSARTPEPATGSPDVAPAETDPGPRPAGVPGRLVLPPGVWRIGDNGTVTVQPGSKHIIPILWEGAEP